MAAQSGDPVVIQSKLSALFKLTTTTADLTDIVTAGDIVQVRRPGLVMFAVGSQLGPTNTYKAGRISQGFGTLMVMSNKQTVQRRFVPGEKFWVTRVMVQNDSISFDLFSDPYFDVRYYANLKVMFPDKKTVPPVDTAIQLVAEVLTPGNGGGQGAQPAPAPVAPPAPVDAIAPPPPPTDAPPPTIALDQTPEQVVAGFGQPMRVAKLGAKEIYYYKDMKVTFTSGKVTNVE
jgi:hypothetical protein